MNATSVEQAYRNMQGIIRKTPLLLSRQLSQLNIGSEVFLKLENEQVTGSFKARGALQVMASLTEEQRGKGVIAPTAGNHGMGLSYAGKAAGVPVHIYLPHSADASKVRYMQENGATVTYFPDIETARQAAFSDAASKGLTFVSAYNNPHMVVGAGTVAVETLAEQPDLGTLIVCTGGGGLTAGVGLYLKAHNPTTRLVAVQAENSPTIAEWLRYGKVTEVALKPSVAEGLSGLIDPSTVTFPILKEVVDEVVTVSEAEIVAAMQWLLDEHQIIAEPSGAAAVAAVLAGKVQLSGKKAALTVTGGNVSPERFTDLLRLSRVYSTRCSLDN